MKICILGAGALGCAMGGVLTEAGHEVWLINRNAGQVDAMTRDGLILRSDGADRAIAVHAATTAQGVDLTSGAVDLIVVLVKSFHTRVAMASATCLLGPNTTVLSLQNGLGHGDILAEIVGRERLLAGKTYVGGSQLGLGHVLAGTRGKPTYIGELDGSVSLRATQIAQTFTQAGLETTASDRIMGIIWDKLLVNVATGAVSGITRLPYGELYQMPDIEAVAGAGLPYEFRTSMLQSLDKGSITEIDFINGVVLRLGAKLGVATPVNQTLVACIKGIERGMKISNA